MSCYCRWVIGDMGCDRGGLSLVVGLEERELAGMCDEGDPGGWRTSVKGADSMVGDGGVYAVSWSCLLLLKMT